MKPVVACWTMFFLGCVRCEDNLEFTKIDIAKLATHTYGTELLLLENSHYTESKSYKFEDFFWTGSGDGPTENTVWTSDDPQTVYETSTVTGTVFVETPPTTRTNGKSHKPNCTALDCDTRATPEPAPEIDSTPPLTGPDSTYSNASQQYWLLTMLKGADRKEPVTSELKNSLEKLYRIAFQRQQARHLGIVALRQKRTAIDKPVSVYIHELNRMNVRGEDKIELLYHVEVAGKPVDAYTAAGDMQLVTDEEVIQELGYSFDIKAEPYVKASEPQSLSKAKNTWFVMGVSIIGLLLILLVLAFIILGVTKRKRSAAPSGTGTDNRRHVFERGAGHDNKGLVRDDETMTESMRGRDGSPTYINFENQHLPSSAMRSESSFSGTSSSSSSLDISPLMNLGKKHRTPPKKPPRPRAALNKTVPLNTSHIRQLPREVLDSDSASAKESSPELELNRDPGVNSPKSYLSMPSVKSFPRTNMPEPLNRVLQPVSVTHLDMPDGSGGSDSSKRYPAEALLVRHGSVGTMEDPGVIGPVVWNIHCEKLKHGVSVDQGINEMKVARNVSRMRKRFHDLLDDTFSLFGTSRKSSPVDTADDTSRPIAIEVKSHSANDNRAAEFSATYRTRPKTTGTTQSRSSSGPSCAWSSSAPSPLVRPLSAAPAGDYSRMPIGILKTPKVNVDHVLAEGKFRPSDPAISVIEAIKGELGKVSLPGSSEELLKRDKY